MNELIRFFGYAHLPLHLQATSKQFHDVAEWMEINLPDNFESAAAMRKLLEAKDCAVRSTLVKETK